MSDLIPQILPILYIVVIAIMLLFAFMYYKFLKRERKNMALLFEQQADLIEKNDELDKLFKKVETIKKEWERTADSSGDIIILTDNDGNIKRCNKSLTILTGKTYSELLGTAAMELLISYGLNSEIVEGGNLHG